MPPAIRQEPRAPRSLAAVSPAPGIRGKSGRTLTAAAQTLADALGIVRHSWGRGETPIRGLRGGRLVPEADGVVLDRYSYVPGVWISGFLEYTAFSGYGPKRLDGSIRVGGPAAAKGRLTAAVRLSGTLDGRRVRGPRP